MLGIPNDKVRVVVGDVGGGFGMKTGVYPEDVVLAFCTRAKAPGQVARRAHRGVSRRNHGRDIVSKAELALDADGTVLALRVRSLANVGAYATPTGVVIQLMIGPWVSTSVYDIGTDRYSTSRRCSPTHAHGAYRGAGRPGGDLHHRAPDGRAARQTGIDPVEIRRRNMIRPEQMPYTNAMGQDIRQWPVRARA